MIKPSQEVLKDLYETQGMSAQQIGSIFGVSKFSALRWLKVNGIERRPQSPGLANHGKTMPTREELMQWVYEEHLSYQAIADMFGTTKQAVTYWLNKYEIPHPSVWLTRKKGQLPQMPTKEEFLELYNQGWPVSRIADFLKVPFDTLMGFCKKEGIQLRANGWRQLFTCDDGHRALSVYEQQVDNWLFAHNIPHVVEPPLPFDRRYRADFLANGWYIEVWGVRNNIKYNARKLRKQEAYKEHGLHLIEITCFHFDKRRNAQWERRLKTVLFPP